MTHHLEAGARAVTRLSLLLGDRAVADEWAQRRAGHAALTAQLAALGSTLARALAASSTDTPRGVGDRWGPRSPGQRVCVAFVAILAAAPETAVDELAELIGPERALDCMFAVTAGLLGELAGRFALTAAEAYDLAAALRDTDEDGTAEPGAGDTVATTAALHDAACGVLDHLAADDAGGAGDTRCMLSTLAGLDPFPDTAALVLACGARADALAAGTGIEHAALHLPPVGGNAGDFGYEPPVPPPRTTGEPAPPVPRSYLSPPPSAPPPSPTGAPPPPPPPSPT